MDNRNKLPTAAMICPLRAAVLWAVALLAVALWAAALLAVALFFGGFAVGGCAVGGCAVFWRLRCGWLRGGRKGKCVQFIVLCKRCILPCYTNKHRHGSDFRRGSKFRHFFGGVVV